MAMEIGSLDMTYACQDDMARSGMFGQDSGLRNLSSSDGQDRLGSLPQSGSGTTEPSVAGLRDRLLREARQERIRCLQVARASERWRVDDGGAASPAASVTTSDCAAQTDPVAVTASGSSAPLDPRLAEAWGQSDEDAQMEAIRTIQLLSDKSADTSVTDKRIAELEELLNRERASCRELEAAVAREKQTREAIQQQVLCLEAEMDSKESSLQASQRALDRTSDFSAGFSDDTRIGSRSVQTQPTLPQASFGSNSRGYSPMRAAQQSADPHSFMRAASPTQARLSANTISMVAGEEGNLLAARRQLLERDHKLEAKDQQISQLLRELRQSPVDAGPGEFDRGYSGGGYSSPMTNNMHLTAPSLSFGLRR